MDSLNNYNQLRLSYDRLDIERFFGFQSKKFTMVNYLFTFIIGLIFTAAFYGVLLIFYQKQERGHHVRVE